VRVWVGARGMGTEREGLIYFGLCPLTGVDPGLGDARDVDDRRAGDRRGRHLAGMVV
jgi:hypothetical protein